MDTVSVLRCEDYNLPDVLRIVRQSFDNIGGVGKFIKPGDKVLLKLNLIMKKNPANAATTHPVFAEALSLAVMEAGAAVIIADSPGGPYNEAMLRSVYTGCGIADVAQRLGIALNYDTAYSRVDFPDGRQVKSFPIINPVLNADVVISVPKLKTHMMTFYSGAVKNMFGCIPGLYKAEYHFSMPERERFCAMLVDLCQCVRPTLSFMDAIVGMEGQGPTGGTPRKFGAVLASASPYALDLVAARMVGITPQEAPTIAESQMRSLCTELSLAGDPLDGLLVSDLIKPPIGTPDFFDRRFIPKPVSAWLRRSLAPKPDFNYGICVGCGDCVRSCPTNALHLKYKRPVLASEKCISCFCCQELCPAKAIQARRNRLIGRM